MREILKRRFSSAPPTEEPPVVRRPVLSFGSWDDLGPGDPAVVIVCRPDWRGVRTAAYSFREPTVECDNLDGWGGEIIAGLRSKNVTTVVVHGFPPGSGSFIGAAHAAGISTRVVLHSSMKASTASTSSSGSRKLPWRRTRRVMIPNHRSI